MMLRDFAVLEFVTDQPPTTDTSAYCCSSSGAATVAPRIAPVPAPSTPPAVVPFSRVVCGCPQTPHCTRATSAVTSTKALSTLCFYSTRFHIQGLENINLLLGAGPTGEHSFIMFEQ
jgi:hypothetical protein